MKLIILAKKFKKQEKGIIDLILIIIKISCYITISLQISISKKVIYSWLI